MTGNEAFYNLKNSNKNERRVLEPRTMLKVKLVLVGLSGLIDFNVSLTKQIGFGL